MQTKNSTMNGRAIFKITIPTVHLVYKNEKNSLFKTRKE